MYGALKACKAYPTFACLDPVQKYSWIMHHALLLECFCDSCFCVHTGIGNPNGAGKWHAAKLKVGMFVIDIMIT